MTAINKNINSPGKSKSTSHELGNRLFLMGAFIFLMVTHIIGIYKISSITKSNRFYIGSSFDIDKRWKEHIRQLKNNCHHSAFLQRHFNKYGVDDIVFDVIEEHNSCTIAYLLSREQYFIDTLRPVFNSYLIAGSSLGYKHSKETCAKMNVYSRKKVYQFNVNGDIIREYCSLRSVGDMGFSQSLVGGCCKKKSLSHCGFLWSYNPNDGMPLSIAYSAKEEKRNECMPKSVLQVSFTGEVIRLWKSARMADKFGFYSSLISACCKDVVFSHKGFIWLFSDDSIDRKLSLFRKAHKPVDQIDKNGILIKTWFIMSDVKKIGLQPNYVIKCLSGKMKTYKGFFWRYNESLLNGKPSFI
jgi:group I intron endonuclease